MVGPVILVFLSLSAFALGPSFSEERGVKTAPFDLEITASEGGTLYCSTDGSEPTAACASPLHIEGTTIVRAFEEAGDGSRSAVETHSYLFLDQVVSASNMSATITQDPTYGPIVERTLQELPTLAITLPGGLTSTEKEGSVEWIDPATDSLQVDCGVREVGGTSVGYAKNTMRLSFRSEYGAGHWDADLFADFASGLPPADSFDALTLRMGSHDSVFYLSTRGQYLRNRWMDESQLAMGHVAPHGRFAHLYMNGVYEGQYHVRERFNAAMMASYFGGEEEDYEALNAGTAIDGSGAAWAAVVAHRDSYEEVKEWVNLENFLDYMILNWYAANDWDWNPTQNWMAAGPKEAGKGGFIFHSSDSDICLVYPYDTNILAEVGPSYLFYYLSLEGHPDFMSLLSDRLYANLENGGPLTAEVAAERYLRLAGMIEESVVAESARWGGGWWDRDDEWDSERENLLTNFFPYRTEALIQQVEAAGWYALGAPDFDREPGVVAAGETLTVSVPAGVEAELWVRTDGGDPRLSGGDTAPEATNDGVVGLDHGHQVLARLKQGETWGPLREGLFEVDEAPALILNEWNAVEPDKSLSEGDASLGALAGNGGDWLEFLVIEDHLDLRGWTLEMADRSGDRGELVFGDHPVLADLRSGTLFTIAEELPEDLALNPEGGDWRFHLRAGAEGSGLVISATPFDITPSAWQLTIRDADGAVRFGPVGEGVAPWDGISGSEVGRLAATPDGSIRRDSADYGDADGSTFGAANTWGGGSQDLSELRSVVPLVILPDTGSWDTAGSEDSGRPDAPDETGQPGDSGVPPAEAGCGCAQGGGGGLWWALIPAIALLRRRRMALGLLLGGCGSPNLVAVETAVPDSTPQDTAPVDEPVDTAPPPTCYEDLDGDSYGAAELPCAEGGIHRGGDCDDTDPMVNPQAPEVCGGGDEDCDGLTDEADPDLADPLPFYTDADGDGYGDGYGAACALGSGFVLQGGDCDDSDPEIHPDATEICDEIDQDCDGDAGAGAGPACALSSCLEVLTESPGASSGAYWIALPSGEAVELWCDMDTDGGGWTLGFLRNTASTGNQPDFGDGDVDPDLLGVSPEEASSDSTARLGWIDLNDFDYADLQLGAYGSGTQSYRSDAIPRTALRIDFGEPGYLLYGGDTPYYWCGGPNTYTDSGVGAVNNPAGAPSDCRGHGSLGSGWDFSESTSANQGLTLCGQDGSHFLAASWGGGWTYYGAAGAAQAIWVR